MKIFKKLVDMDLLKKYIFDIIEFGAVLFKVLFFSKYFLKLPKRNHSTLIYLANGPSLKENLNKTLDSNIKCDIMVSNYFYKSEYFFKLKPNFYTICDPSFKYEPVIKFDHFKDFYLDLFRLVNWEMYLFIPYLFKRDVKNICKHFNLINDNIKITYYNSINFNIPNLVVFKFFDMNLGMPSCTTVAVPSVMLGLFMGYSKIGIAGVDINMHQNIVVGKDNVVKIIEEHFYEDKKNIVESPFYKNTLKKLTFTSSETFFVFHKMLKSFDSIKLYSEYKNVNIINYSTCSFLDQFEKV